jgi:hypothetical protein
MLFLMPRKRNPYNTNDGEKINIATMEVNMEISQKKVKFRTMILSS